MSSGSGRKYGRAVGPALALLHGLFVLLWWTGAAEAAHPLRLTDYSTRSRVGLEVAYGQMKEPLPSDYLHYLLSVEANVYSGTHVLIGVPFSGYSSIDGGDSFIRGNVLVGATYSLTPTDWLAIGFGLRLYLPTFQRAEAALYPVEQDPRRAALSHWHYRFQYAIEDRFPFAPELALKAERWGLFAQLEGGFSFAPEVREREEVTRKAKLWLLHYGFGAGYDIMGYVEIGAAITGLADPEEDAGNVGEIMGLPFRRPRSMHVVTAGPRAQYKWAAFRFEANFPIERRFRDSLDPYHLFAFHVQFP